MIIFTFKDLMAAVTRYAALTTDELCKNGCSRLIAGCISYLVRVHWLKITLLWRPNTTSQIHFSLIFDRIWRNFTHIITLQWKNLWNTVSIEYTYHYPSFIVPIFLFKKTPFIHKHTNILYYKKYIILSKHNLYHLQNWLTDNYIYILRFNLYEK